MLTTESHVDPVVISPITWLFFCRYARVGKGVPGLPGMPVVALCQTLSEVRSLLPALNTPLQRQQYMEATMTRQGKKSYIGHYRHEEDTVLTTPNLPKSRERRAWEYQSELSAPIHTSDDALEREHKKHRAQRSITKEYRTCNRCFAPNHCLVVDNSDGEYESVAICRQCIQNMFI